MQFNTGKQFDDLVENDLLRDVDRQAAAQNWTAILPTAFIQAVTRDGHIYAVPVNIHGQNWLFYSTSSARAGRRAEPNNWDELFPALDKLKAAGADPARVQRPEELGAQPVQQRDGGPRRTRLFVRFWGKRDVPW